MRQVDIKGFEDYQITDDGRVWSKKTNRWLKLLTNDKGYYCVNLYNDGKATLKPVHRLIAEAFIPNPDKKPFIDHRNTIRTDNSISNLHWVTQKENCNNPKSIEKYKKLTPPRGCMKGKHHSKETKEKLSKKVYQYTLDGQLIKIWDSTMECGKNGFPSPIVSLACNKKYIREGNNIYKGFIWKYQ